MLHNECKVRTFYYLSQFTDGETVPVSVIARNTGCSRSSLAVLVGRWVKWNYLKRYTDKSMAGFGEVHCYALTRHGRAYLDRLPRWNPLLQSLVVDVLATGGVA